MQHLISAFIIKKCAETAVPKIEKDSHIFITSKTIRYSFIAKTSKIPYITQETLNILF